MLKRVLDWLNGPSASVLKLLNEINKRQISYILLFVIAVLVLFFVYRIITEQIQKLIPVSRRYKKTAKEVLKTTKEFGKINVLTVRDFLLFPENFKQEFVNPWLLFLKSGVALMFPKERLKVHFGEFLQFKPIDECSQENGDIKINIKSVLFISKKLSRVEIEIKNVSLSPIHIEMGVSARSLKKWIQLMINNKVPLEIKTIDCKHDLSNRNLASDDSFLVQMFFKTLDGAQIRKLKSLKINMYLKKSRNGEHKDFMFFLPILGDQADIGEFLNSQVNLKSYLVFLSFGGYLLVVVIIAVTLFIIGNLMGRWFQIATEVFTLFLIILAINLNSRLAQLIFDFVNQKNEMSS